jgi:hypothetical protein
MTRTRQAAPGAIGGSVNEQAAELRGRVGAVLARTIITGDEVEDAGLEVVDAVGVSISAETDDPVDDLVVELRSGGQIFVQVKLRATLDRVGKSGTRAAVEQFARALSGGLQDNDRLVLATPAPVADLVAIGKLVDRERNPRFGNRTGQELRGLAKLQAIAADYMSDRELEEMLKHLVIWKTDPTQGDGQSALISGLISGVVEPGSGMQAARDLTDVIRSIARKRAGLDGLALVEELRRRKLPLQRHVDPGSSVAMAQALAKHRAAELRHGSTLRLFGVPAALANLPLAEADAGVLVDYRDSRTGNPLERLLRRLGRVLLVGDPGGGKSTAIGAISAYWASTPDWPVPIRVHLRRMADAQTGLTDALLDSATADLQGNERNALREALAHKLMAGESLILLDGVDEVGAGRVSFLDGLRDWLNELPEGNEVLIATRPSAEEEAATLGLERLSLRPPDAPRQTARAILEAAAPSDAADAGEWVQTRMNWLTEAFERDSALEHTPLIVVTLAVTAAQSDRPQELPRRRAEILERALFDAVRRWDVEKRAQGKPMIGPFPGTQAEEAITIALIELCRAAIASAPVREAQAHAAVTAVFESEFGAAPAQARSGATDAVQFWLDTGLFSFDAGTLTARRRPLAEVGVAHSYKSAEPEIARSWVSRARADKILWPVLALGAGLSKTLTGLWVESFSNDGPVDELIEIVDAVSDGAVIDESDIDTLLERSRHLLKDAERAERVAEAIIMLPLDHKRRTALRPALLAAVPSDRRLLVESFIVTRWNETGIEADQVLRTLIATVEPDPDEPHRGEDGILQIRSSSADGPHQATYEAAAIRLAKQGRTDAELVVAHRFGGSIGHHQKVMGVLRDAGHDDLAEQFNARWKQLAEQRSAFLDGHDFDGDTERLLALTAGLAPPRALTQIQSRRMDDLTALFETAGLGHLHPSWSEHAPDTTRDWLRAVAELGGLDIAIVSAQADQLAREISDQTEDHFFPYELGEDRDLANWDAVTDVESTRAVLVDAFGRIRARDGRLPLALHIAPAKENAIPLLEARLKKAKNRKAMLIAWSILLCATESDADQRAETLSSSDDPMMRMAAAEWWSLRAASQRAATPQFVRCLADTDENVRAAALTFLRSELLTDELTQQLSKVKTDRRRGWQCTTCGATNADIKRACTNCSTTGPDARTRASELLGDEKLATSDWLSRLRTDRRVRR